MKKVVIGLFLLLGVVPVASAVSMSDVKEDFESYNIGLLSGQGWVMASGDGEVVIGHNSTKEAKASGGYMQGTHGASGSGSYVYSTGISVSSPGQAYMSAQLTPGYAGNITTYTVIGTEKADGHPGPHIGMDVASSTSAYNGLGRFCFEGANWGTIQRSEDIKMFDSNGNPYTFDVAVTLNITNASSITATLYYRNVSFGGNWVQSSVLTNVPFDNTFGIQSDGRTYLRGYVRTDIDNFRMGMGPAIGSDLVISPNGGSFSTPQTVTISGATEGSTIHYTLNGANPTLSDPVCSGPITVSQKLTLKAQAFLPDGYATSQMATADFVLPFAGTKVEILPKYDLTVEGTPYFYVLDFPTYTLTTNFGHGQDTSIYYQFDLSSLAAISLPSWSSGLRINSVQFCGVSNSATGGADAVFQDALYPVSSNWTSSTITYANRPARGARLCTWDFTSYGGVNWYYTSSPALTSQIQAVVDDATSKLISFNVAAVNPPNLNAGSHYYLDNLSYGVPGNYSTRLWIYYDFAAGPQLDNVTISPSGGSYGIPKTVTMSCTAPGAVIHYTLDGTDPTEDSPVYSSGILVSHTMTVRARAFLNGHMPSAVAVAKFTFPMVGQSVDLHPIQYCCIRSDNYKVPVGEYSGFGNINGVFRTYVTYDLSQLDSLSSAGITINQVLLRVYLTSDSIGSPFINGLYTVADTTWTEAGMTLDNRPAMGALLMGFDPYGMGWREFTAPADNLTNYIQVHYTPGSKVISFAIESIDAPAGSYVSSHETDTYRPWLRVYYSLPPVATPVINPPGGVFSTAQQATITCPDSQATIVYSLAAADPLVTRDNHTYTGPVTVQPNQTLTARAYRDGYSPSAVAQATFMAGSGQIEIMPIADTGVEAPGDFSYSLKYDGSSYLFTGTNHGPDNHNYILFDLSPLTPPAGGTVTIDNVTFYGVTVYSAGAPYQDHLYAVEQTDWTESTITYEDRPALGDLLASYDFPSAGTSQYWVTSDALKNFVVSKYATPAKKACLGIWGGPGLDSTQTHGYNERYGAYSAGYSWRLQVNYTLTLARAETPVISPAGGGFATAQNVTITCATSGATIRYTTDGSTPNNNSPVYSDPIIVSTATTIKAAAFPALGSGLYQSDVASATFSFPTTLYPPAEIPYGTADVDGDLSDWPAGTTGWTPLNVVYDGTPSDISEAYYYARWTPDKIYVAVKVLDLIPTFTNSYTEWNARDAVEIYLHTTGVSSNRMYAMSEAAQQYAVGITDDDRTVVWTDLGYKMSVPEVCNFEAAGKQDGDWLVYEVAVTPFQYMGAFVGKSSTTSPVVGNQVIGLDVTVVGNNGLYTGMKAANNLTNKSNDYDNISLHRLVDANSGSTVTGTVALQNYLPGPNGHAATVQLIQAGQVARTQNVTLNDAGQFMVLAVPTGTYDVRVAATGWLAATKTGIAVSGLTVDAGTFTLANGDANGDNQVTFEDFAMLQNHYGESVAVGTNGDFNGDGKVGFADFSVLQNSYGQSGTTSAAPAASTSSALALTPCGLVGIALLALIGLVSLRWRD